MTSSRRAAQAGLAAVGALLLLAAKGQDKNPAALLKAAQAGSVADVQAALKAGVDVNAADESGSTALSIAAYGGHGDVVQALLAANADVNRANRKGLTPLM